MVIQEEAAAAPPSAATLVSREEQRNQLILEHLSQVRLIAKQINDRLPVSVGMDDLVSAGIIGLIAAIDRYNPDQHVKLRTFAEYKIRGAILDSLRSMDWAPRQQRRRRRLIDSAVAMLEQRLYRIPTETEVAEQLSVPVERYQDWLAAVSSLRVDSLDAMGTQDREPTLPRHLFDSSGISPSAMAEQAELENLAAQAIEQLPGLEKTILHLYYYEEMTLREIARIVALHESRISQLKSQALEKLRSALAIQKPNSKRPEAAAGALNPRDPSAAIRST